MYGEVTLMDLVSILLIAIIAVVLLLQIIALAQIAPLRKAIRELKEIKAAPPSPAPSADRFERKGGDFRRHEKRPFHDQRPRSAMQNQGPAAPHAPASPAVDPVETSLRDINLRLKNAERDQENARKKIQENLGDRDQHHRGHDRGNDRYRDSGDRNRGGRDGRDRNRNPRRDNWQDRNRQAPPQTQPQPYAAPVVPGADSEPAPAFERKEFVSVPPTAPSPVEQMTPPVSVAPAVVAPTAPAPDQESAEFNAAGEGFEHGRKVFVKRRPLRDESGEGSETPVQAKEETSFEPSAEAETEIQFGRRKGI